MKHLVFAIFIAATITGCNKPTSKGSRMRENTEEYFKAHGILQGQPNELRIGNTIFQFPANMGLNPYTAQETYISADGSPLTLALKEGLEQGKYEMIETPIVKGQADKVTFYLDSTNNFKPSTSPFGGGIRVEISNIKPRSWDGVNINLEEYLQEMAGRKIIDHPASGLREYVASSANSSGLFEDIRQQEKSTSGHGKLFSCQSGLSGYCFISYWDENGRYRYEIVVEQAFVLEHWPEMQPSIHRFVDSVAVK